MNEIVSEEDLIILYISNECSEEQRNTVNNLLENDENFRKIFQDYQKLAKLTEEPYIDFNVKKAKAKFDKKYFNTFRFNSKTIITIAASLAIIISISFLFYNSKPIIIASKTDITELKMLDGSDVVLNRYSKIKHAKNFTKKRELELLQGEAYFHVIKNGNIPFTVQVRDFTITVLGTKFNIDANSKDSIIVSVFSGKVRVNYEDDTTSFILTKNECATLFENQTNIYRKETLLNSNNISWKTHIYNFENVMMENVLPVIAKGYNTSFEVKNEKFNTYQLTANFENQPLEVIIGVLEQTFNTHIIKQDSVYIIE